MNKIIKDILKEILVINNIKNREVFTKILKGVKQNNNVQNNIKIYINHFCTKQNKRNFFTSKKHKICLYTGRRNGLFKDSNFSRIKIKNLIINNKFTNIKKHNW